MITTEEEKLIAQKKEQGGDFDLVLNFDDVYDFFKCAKEKVGLELTLQDLKRFKEKEIDMRLQKSLGLLNNNLVEPKLSDSKREKAEKLFKEKNIDLWALDEIYKLRYTFYSFKYKSKIHTCRLIHSADYIGTNYHSEILEQAIQKIDPDGGTVLIKDRANSYNLYTLVRDNDIDTSKYNVEKIKEGGFWHYFAVYPKIG